MLTMVMMTTNEGDDDDHADHGNHDDVTGDILRTTRRRKLESACYFTKRLRRKI